MHGLDEDLKLSNGKANSPEEWLNKLKEEAISQGKICHALAFNFGGDRAGIPNYYVLDERNFQRFVALLEESMEE